MSAGSLVTKVKKGRPYLYWVRSARVDGKPRIVEQLYLGPKERVLQEIHDHYAHKPGPAPELRRVQVRTFGGPALLWALAGEWDLAGIIDRHVPAGPPRVRTSLSVGRYLVLAAINRALDPHSKRSFGSWYRGTVLERLCPAQPWELTSQRFWDHMHQVEPGHIAQIQGRLLEQMDARFPVAERCLLYDTTNYYTFINTFNDRNELAQRGHNKQKRADLRQVGLVLVVDEGAELPLYHEVYTGNRVDVSQFGEVVERLQQHFAGILGKRERKLTLVFDKGNVSGPNLERLAEEGIYYVGAVPLAWVRQLEQVPLCDYEPLSLGEGGRIKVYRCRHMVAGKERTVVMAFSPSFFWEQRRSLNRLQQIAEGKLSGLRDGVVAAASEGKPRKASAVTREAAQITRPDRLSLYVAWEVKTEDERVVDLSWHCDLAKKREIQRRCFGKTALITDREDFGNEQVVRAYRSQYLVEDCFRVTKSRDPGMWWPIYHWTDSHLQVHALYCHLSLLLLRLVQLRLREHGLHLSVGEMVERLNGISEVLIVYANGAGQRVVAEMNEQQEVVFRALGLHRFRPEMGNTPLTG